METKYCPACEKHKPHDEFYKRGGGLQTNCKICKSRIDREYNQTSDKKRNRKKQRDRELRDWVNSYKAEKGCAYCSEREPLFLDFHHVGDKEFTVSTIQRRSRKVIEAEIRKCVVVCCRCHRMIHAGWNGPWILPQPSKRSRCF